MSILKQVCFFQTRLYVDTQLLWPLANRQGLVISCAEVFGAVKLGHGCKSGAVAGECNMGPGAQRQRLFD